MKPSLQWFLTVGVSAALGAFLCWIFVRSPQERLTGGGTSAEVAQTLWQGRPVGAPSDAHWVDRVRDPRTSLRELRRLGESAALQDPVAAVRAAQEIPGYDNRGVYLASVLAAWGERDGAVAAEWVREHFKGEQQAEALYQVADGWAESDPAGAGAWFLENTDGTVRIDALWEVLEAWGRKDPKAGAEWSAVLEEELRWEVIDGLADGWAAVDPQGAAAFAERLSDADAALDFYRSVATQWAAYDPQAAIRWAEGLKHEATAEAVHVELAEIWAAQDPEAAAKWVEQLKDTSRARWAREGLARGRAEHDPGAALTWVLSQSAGMPGDEDLIGEIVSSWSEVDPSQLSQWLDQRPRDGRDDPVLSQFSASILELDPRAALLWAAEIANPETRQQQLQQLAGEWLAMEGQRAIPEIEALGLPIDLKALLGE